MLSGCTPASSPTPTVAEPTPIPTAAPVVVPTPDATPTPSPPPSDATSTPLPTPTPERSEPPKPSSEEQPIVPSASLGNNRSLLAVVLDNQWVFIKNGGTVNLGKGISVELSLDPYPPAGLRAFLNMYITLNGAPLTGVEANMEYDMRGMAHGPFRSSAKNTGNGRYVFAVDHTEFGAWEHQVTIYTPEDHIELTVGIIALP